MKHQVIHYYSEARDRILCSEHIQEKPGSRNFSEVTCKNCLRVFNGWMTQGRKQYEKEKRLNDY
jgi:hypothetical protein